MQYFININDLYKYLLLTPEIHLNYTLIAKKITRTGFSMVHYIITILFSIYFI